MVRFLQNLLQLASCNEEIDIIVYHDLPAIIEYFLPESFPGLFLFIPSKFLYNTSCGRNRNKIFRRKPCGD